MQRFETVDKLILAMLSSVSLFSMRTDQIKWKEDTGSVGSREERPVVILGDGEPVKQLCLEGVRRWCAE